LADVNETPRDGCRHSHRRADQMSAPAASLTTLEVAIRSRSAAFAGLKNVGIHPEAHAATRLSPIKPGLLENSVEPFALRLLLDPLRTRNDHRVKPARDLSAIDHAGRCAKVFDPRIGA